MTEKQKPLMVSELESKYLDDILQDVYKDYKHDFVVQNIIITLRGKLIKLIDEFNTYK